jgi:hypothetical protein
LWKHRGAAVERTAGALGRIVWPAMLLFQVALPLATPPAFLALVVAIAAGNPRPAIVASTLLFATELAQIMTACVLARRTHASAAWRLLPSLLTSRIIYRPLLLVVSLRSIGRLLDGVPLGWGKLARRNTAVAYAAATRTVRVTR